MYNFFRNVLRGLGTLTGIIMISLIVLIIGAVLALIFGTLGLIGYGVFKVLGWLIASIGIMIFGLWIIGWISRASE